MCGDEGEGARWAGLVAELPLDLADDVRKRWPEFFAVCGGNIGQLAYCLNEVRTKGVAEGEPPDPQPSPLVCISKWFSARYRLPLQQCRGTAAVQEVAQCCSQLCA